MAFEFDPTFSLKSADLENMEINLPEKEVQIRMANDVKALVKKGMDEDKAVNWVFTQKQAYIDNPDYSSINN